MLFLVLIPFHPHSTSTSIPHSSCPISPHVNHSIFKCCRIVVIAFTCGIAMTTSDLCREWSDVLAQLDNLAYLSAPRSSLEWEDYDDVRGRITTLMQRHVELHRLDQSRPTRPTRPKPPPVIKCRPAVPKFLTPSTCQSRPSSSTSSRSDRTLPEANANAYNPKRVILARSDSEKKPKLSKKNDE